MLPGLDVENVYLYVADAVRYDFAPDAVLDLGTSARTVAAGIHSPTSIASMVSGTYLPQHGVGDFRDTLPGDVPDLLDLDGYAAGFANTMNDVRFDPGGSHDAMADTLDVPSGSPELLGSIEEPFCFVERGPGGHAPYVDRLELDTAANYFEDRRGAGADTFTREYREAVAEDADWFSERLEVLEDRGIREDTLVVYTSDHGEALGERGMLSHTPPIHPAHVYVPTVFVHPDLDRRHVAGDGRVVRGVDLLPTLAGALGADAGGRLSPAGRDLTEDDPATRGATFHGTTRATPLGDVEVAFEAAWDATGGHVFPRTGPAGRLALGVYHLLRAPWRSYARANALEHLSFKLAGHRVHRPTTLSAADAREYLRSVRESGTTRESPDENEVPRERLEELGYLE